MTTMMRSGFAALALAAAAGFGTAALADDYDGEAKATTKRAAMNHAISDWKREVKEETGHWARWKTAKGKEMECERDGAHVECEVEATPAH